MKKLQVCGVSYLTALAVGVFTSGCAAPSKSVAAPAATSQATPVVDTRVGHPLGEAPGTSQKGSIQTSRLKSYASVAALTGDSDNVVIATAATPAPTVESVGGLPFSVTAVTVSRSLKGTAGVGQVLRVRQVGTPTTAGAAVMQPGAQYLLYLDDFHYAQDDKTGQSVLVGAGAGLFAVAGGDATRLDSDSPALPAKLSLTAALGS